MQINKIRNISTTKTLSPEFYKNVCIRANEKNAILAKTHKAPKTIKAPKAPEIVLVKEDYNPIKLLIEIIKETFSKKS